MKLVRCFLFLLITSGATPLFAQNVEYDLTLTGGSATPGEWVTITSVLNDPQGEELTGWSLAVCQTGESAEIHSVTDGETVSQLNGGQGPEFSSVSITPTLGWTATVTVSFNGTVTLPPGLGHELHLANYLCLQNGTVELAYCDDLGDPPTSTLLYDRQGASVIPVTQSASIQIQGTVPVPFIRGDANGDGQFAGIADSLQILNFLFLSNQPPPPCLAAADADGDHTFDGLPDAMFILNYNFIPGTPAPPFPFPTCDLETQTTNVLGCLVTPCP